MKNERAGVRVDTRIEDMFCDVHLSIVQSIARALASNRQLGGYVTGKKCKVGA